MNSNNDPTEPRAQPPVLRYAAIIGIIIVVGLIATVIVGRSSQNPRPTALQASPSPGVSTGPTPRY